MNYSALPYRPCVGVLVFNGDGLVWVGRRIGSPNQGEAAGWWQMPQGGIDPGEEPADAAMRELAEETGMRSGTIVGETREWYSYDLPPQLLGRVWGGRYRGQTQKWFAIRFTGTDSEIDIYPSEHDPEFDSWRWAPLDDLLRLVVPFKRDVYGAVIRELGPLVRNRD